MSLSLRDLFANVSFACSSQLERLVHEYHVWIFVQSIYLAQFTILLVFDSCKENIQQVITTGMLYFSERLN